MTANWTRLFSEKCSAMRLFSEKCSTLVDKFQRKFKFLRSKMPIFKAQFGKTYLVTKQTFYSDPKQMTRALRLNSMKYQ